MSEEAEGKGSYQHDRTGNVGGAMRVASPMLNDWHEHGKRSGRKQDAGSVDADAADPFFKVVAVGPENKPLISQKSERDGEQIGE